MSFERPSPSTKKASGGSGGPGGNVYIIVDRSLTNLSFETYHFNGGDGSHGGSAGLTGKSGKDVFIRVPAGVVLKEYIPDYEDSEVDK